MVVGIRAGNLHPARSRPDLPVEARLDLVESLGSESMAYFRIGRRRCRPAGADEAEEEIEEGGEGVTATRPNLVAAFPPTSG